MSIPGRLVLSEGPPEGGAMLVTRNNEEEPHGAPSSHLWLPLTRILANIAVSTAPTNHVVGVPCLIGFLIPPPWRAALRVQRRVVEESLEVLHRGHFGHLLPGDGVHQPQSLDRIDTP